jgi:hypothetical protein
VKDGVRNKKRDSEWQMVNTDDQVLAHIFTK